MKIYHLSTRNRGGAGKVAERIHKELLFLGINSKMIVRKQSNSNHVLSNESQIERNKKNLLTYLDRLPNYFISNNIENLWSLSLFSSFSKRFLDQIKSADIIKLYWVNEGFINLRDIKKILELNKPVIWRLSVMWPFTGGCYYSKGCLKYKNICSECHFLKKIIL